MITPVDRDIAMERLGLLLLDTREQLKALEARETEIRKQLAELWGSLEVKSESRIYGTVRITARTQVRMEYNAQEVEDYFHYVLNAPELFEEIVVKSVPRQKIEQMVAKGELPTELLSLLHEAGSYVVWKSEILGQ